jgi:DNA-binding response OmpR family regulator
MSTRDEAHRKAQETMRRLQHEVRTPISQIVGYSELLEEELEDRGHQDLAPDLGRIRHAAQRLLDLVDGKLRSSQDPGAPPLSDDDAPASPAPEEADQVEPEAAGSEGPRILVVDGDADQRELLARRFQRYGFAVETARDGIDALRRIESADPDLVMLEVLLPGMNGLEVLERVRRQRSRAELPIILATELETSDDVIEGLKRGANDYVTKPFDFPVVIARVRTQLELHGTARQLAGLAHQLEFRSAFIRQALGRDISDELLVEMAERPGALELGAETRAAVAVVADVRGGRNLAASLPPAELSAVLSNVLGGLGDVVAHYEGTVDAVNGDSLVALFGLPLSRDDDLERAVACAVALQLEMDEINARSGRAQLPSVSIGVGVASGEVVVVGFGSGDQLRYKAVGEPLVRATGIEATAEGGEVWICESTRRALGELVRVDQVREIALPPARAPAQVHRVLGVGGSQIISLRSVPAR